MISLFSRLRRPAPRPQAKAGWRRNQIVVAVALCMIEATALAQTPPSPGPAPSPPATVTTPARSAPAAPAALVQAVRKAVQENPEILARFNALRVTDAQRGIANAGRRPRLDFTANAGVERSATPLADYGNYGTAASRLVFSQMLYDGGFNASEIERLGYSRLTRLYELYEISETVAFEAIRAYADVIRYRELVQAATENFVEHRQIYEQVEERARAGVGRRVDVEQASGRMALSESNLLTELTNLHDVSSRYQRIVGEQPPAALAGLPFDFRFADLPSSAVKLLSEGLSRNPAINAAMENVRARRQAVSSRQLSRKPRVDLRAFQTLGRNSGGTPGSTRTQGAEAVLNFSLLDGGVGDAQERQAAFERDEARDLQDKVCRDTRQTLAIAYSDVNSLQLQLKYRDEHRLTTEKSREAYRQQFEIGQRTLLDLLDSQNEFFEATRSYINTRYDQLGAQARLLAGMGRLVDTMGVARADMPTPQDMGQDRQAVDPAELCPAETPVVATIERIKSELPPSARRVAPGGADGAAAPTAIPAPVKELEPTGAPSGRQSSVDAPASDKAASEAPTSPAAEPVNTSAWMSMATVDPAPAIASPPPLPAPAATPAVPTAPAPAAAPAPPQPAPNDREAVLSALRAWIDAWTKRDLQAYTAAYSADFKGTMPSREDWLQRRTERILPRRRIKIDVGDEVIAIQGDEARIHFRQRYDSDAYRDEERRAISMRRIDGRWLITQESRR